MFASESLQSVAFKTYPESGVHPVKVIAAFPSKSPSMSMYQMVFGLIVASASLQSKLFVTNPCGALQENIALVASPNPSKSASEKKF